MKTSGYTLLEVMVALIIIGISITAVTGALSTAKGLSGRADQAIESVRIMKNILNNPELMGQILANRNFEKMLEDEDGWICKAETIPLVIDSSDLLWDDAGNGNYGVDLKRNKSRKNSRDIKERYKTEKGKGRKSTKGEEIEIPGMVSILLCVSQTKQLTEKEYCVVRWKRVDGSNETEVITKTAKEGSEKLNEF